MFSRFELAQQNPQTNSSTGAPKTASWTDSDIDRMVKARLDQSIVVKLVKLGYKLSVIQ